VALVRSVRARQYFKAYVAHFRVVRDVELVRIHHTLKLAFIAHIIVGQEVMQSEYSNDDAMDGSGNDFGWATNHISATSCPIIAKLSHICL